MFSRVSIGVFILVVALAAHAVAGAAEPHFAAREITNTIGIKLVRIGAGEFQMGSSGTSAATAAFFNKTYGKPALKPSMFNDEHPQHRVRILRPIYISVYPVTRGQFRQFVAGAMYHTDAENGKLGACGWNTEKNALDLGKDYSWRNAGFEQTDSHPVVNVSWNDAAEFCKWLSKKEGKAYRLPTEAQWEYACRAGSTSRFFYGDDVAKLEEYAWYGSNSSLKTHPVGEKRPNAWGLYDMEGNAMQWCQDWYDETYYSKSPTDDPSGPVNGSDRVVRGSSWLSLNCGCCSASRSHWKMFSASTIGFRVCLVPAE